MSDSKQKTIAICDDHTVVRHAIKTIVQSSEDYIVIGEADDCDSTLRLLEQNDVDILIIDLGLPGRSGLETIYQIRENDLQTKIVVLSMHEEESRVKQALQAGAQAYMLKDITPQEILQALDLVWQGQIFLPKRYEHLRPLVENRQKTSKKDCASQHPLDKLSKREREVFYMLVEGKPNRVIAKQLFLSPRTVETHRARLIKKLGLNSTADLVRYAIKNHLHSV